MPLEYVPVTTADVHQEIRYDRLIHHEDVFRVSSFRRYSRGDQLQVLTEKQKETLKGLLGHQFADNVCHMVIAEASDRLSFTRWDCQDDTAQAWLGKFFAVSGVEDRQSDIHYDCLRDGNTTVGVSWSFQKQRVRLIREEWWDGRCGMFIGYDSGDEPLYAVKDWFYTPPQEMARGGAPTQIWRVLWWEDRMERWYSEDGGISWLPRIESDPETETNSAPSHIFMRRKMNGDPLNLPVIHFPNAGRGTKNYGISEIDGGVLALQDQINDLQWALSSSGRMTAWQMYYAVGIPTNAKLNVGPGETWKASKPDAKFGTLPPGDLSQLMGLYEAKLKALSRMTRTPLHIILGVWPSGEALLRAEQPAVGKANKQANRFKGCWAEVGHRAIEVFNRYNKQGLSLPEDADTALIASRFQSVERRDPLSQSVIVNNLGDVISGEEGLRRMDYTDEQIDKIQTEKNAQAEKDLQRKIAEAPPSPPGSGGGQGNPTPRMGGKSNIGGTSGD